MATKERSWKWSGEKKTPAEMEDIAMEAQTDLTSYPIDEDQMELIRDWMEKWFKEGCGWKRLAKIIAKGL